MDEFSTATTNYKDRFASKQKKKGTKNVVPTDPQGNYIPPHLRNASQRTQLARVADEKLSKKEKKKKVQVVEPKEEVKPEAQETSPEDDKLPTELELEQAINTNPTIQKAIDNPLEQWAVETGRIKKIHEDDKMEKENQETSQEEKEQAGDLTQPTELEILPLEEDPPEEPKEKSEIEQKPPAPPLIPKAKAKAKATAGQPQAKPTVPPKPYTLDPDMRKGLQGATLNVNLVDHLETRLKEEQLLAENEKLRKEVEASMLVPGRLLMNAKEEISKVEEENAYLRTLISKEQAPETTTPEVFNIGDQDQVPTVAEAIEEIEKRTPKTPEKDRKSEEIVIGKPKETKEDEPEKIKTHENETRKRAVLNEMLTLQGVTNAHLASVVASLKHTGVKTHEQDLLANDERKKLVSLMEKMTESQEDMVNTLKEIKQDRVSHLNSHRRMLERTVECAEICKDCLNGIAPMVELLSAWVGKEHRRRKREGTEYSDDSDQDDRSSKRSRSDYSGSEGDTEVPRPPRRQTAPKNMQITKDDPSGTQDIQENSWGTPPKMVEGSWQWEKEQRRLRDQELEEFTHYPPLKPTGYYGESSYFNGKKEWDQDIAPLWACIGEYESNMKKRIAVMPNQRQTWAISQLETACKFLSQSFCLRCGLHGHRSDDVKYCQKHKDHPYMNSRKSQDDWERNEKKLKGFQATVDLFLNEGMGRYWEANDPTEYHVQLMCADPKWGMQVVGGNHWMLAWWRMNGYNAGLMSRRVNILKNLQYEEIKLWEKHVEKVYVKYGAVPDGWNWRDCERVKLQGPPRHLRRTISAETNKKYQWPPECRQFEGKVFPGYWEEPQ